MQSENIFYIRLKEIQFCSSLINLFQVNKMTFFRRIKCSYILEYKVDRFTLIPASREFNFF